MVLFFFLVVANVVSFAFGNFSVGNAACGAVVIAGEAVEAIAVPAWQCFSLGGFERDVACGTNLCAKSAADAGVGADREWPVGNLEPYEQGVDEARFQGGERAVVSKVAGVVVENPVDNGLDRLWGVAQLFVAHAVAVDIESRKYHIGIWHEHRERSTWGEPCLRYRLAPLAGSESGIVATGACHIAVVLSATFGPDGGNDAFQSFRQPPRMDGKDEADTFTGLRLHRKRFSGVASHVFALVDEPAVAECL